MKKCMAIYTIVVETFKLELQMVLLEKMMMMVFLG